MGIDRKSLPDSVLRLVSPAERRAAGLPPPTIEVASRAAAKSNLNRERDLQIQIVSWLRIRGHTVMWSAMHRKLTCTVGWPDITFAVKGRAVALEAKLPGESLSEDQITIRKGMIADGWHYSVVTSLDEARQAVAEAERLAE